MKWVHFEADKQTDIEYKKKRMGEERNKMLQTWKETGGN